MKPMIQDAMSDRRIYYGMAFLAISALVSAGWFGYAWYNRSLEQAAYKDLALSIDGYIKVQHAGSTPEKWTDVTRAFEVGAERHPSSKMHPYFLIYQADTLIAQGKLKEAIALMDKALLEIDRKQPLYTTFALKRALLKMDSDDASQQKQGREELELLSQDATNPMQDMALYYSGLDAENRSDKAHAEKQYKEIIAHKQERSYWYQRALQKVKAGA